MKKCKLLFATLSILMLTALIGCKQANVPGVLPPGGSDSGNADTLINSGIKKLTDKNYDGAVADFDTAYVNNKTDDKAKFFYALAKMGSISIKPQMASFMKNRLGVKNYPLTMNALLSDSWMKEYKNLLNTWAYTPSQNSSNHGYVRVNGTIEHAGNGHNYNMYWFHANDVIQLSAKLFIDGKNWGEAYSSSLTNLTLNADGKYLVPVGYYTQVTGNALDADFTDFWSLSEGEWKTFVTNQKTMLPELGKPTWFNQSAPGIVGDQLTMPVFWMQLAANVLQGNVTGLNGAIADILSLCFGTEFTTAVSVVNSISDNFVATLTQDQLKAFGLDGVLGEQGITELKFGKAEILALFGGLELVKGAIETLGSFNLDTDLKFLQVDWNDPGAIVTEMDTGRWNSSSDIFNNGFLNRRPEYINRSKASYLAAAAKLSTACALYETASGNGNSSLPGIVGEYIAPVKLMINAFKNSVEGSGAFYFPRDFSNFTSMTVWPTTDLDDAIAAVNFSVLFKQDRLTMEKIVELGDSTTGVGKAPVLYKMTDNGSSDSPYQYDKVTASVQINAICDGFAIKILPKDISALSSLMEDMFHNEGGLYVPICGPVNKVGQNNPPHYELVKFFAKYYYGWQ